MYMLCCIHDIKACILPIDTVPCMHCIIHIRLHSNAMNTTTSTLVELRRYHQTYKSYTVGRKVGVPQSVGEPIRVSIKCDLNRTVSAIWLSYGRTTIPVIPWRSS